MGNLNTKQTLENTDAAINNEQSRKTGNIWHNTKNKDKRQHRKLIFLLVNVFSVIEERKHLRKRVKIP